MLNYKSAESCAFDALSLGEIMLRLDPGAGRIHTARRFEVWEGGGEYNVVRGLRRCFGLRSAVVTAFADNPVGRLVEDFILQGGVDTRFIRWIDMREGRRPTTQQEHLQIIRHLRARDAAALRAGMLALARVFDASAVYSDYVSWATHEILHVSG